MNMNGFEAMMKSLKSARWLGWINRRDETGLFCPVGAAMMVNDGGTQQGVLDELFGRYPEARKSLVWTMTRDGRRVDFRTCEHLTIGLK